MSHSKDLFIGFPAGLLDASPWRLKLFAHNARYIALEKPAGIALQEDPWHPSDHTLIQALGAQIDAHKPELERLEVGSAHTVHHLDTEASGAALIATTKESATELKNLWGSEQMLFTYHLLVRPQAGLEETFSCDLPLAQDHETSLMRVSHRSGKKATTHFKRLEVLGPYELWEATSTFTRHHQIRIHAQETGLSIIGDTLYGQETAIYLSQLKRKYKAKSGEESPLSPPLCLHLANIEILPENTQITAPYPKKWHLMLNKLRDL